MKKKLIFILSSNYSGSHFLSLMLGSHSQGVHLGELKNVYKMGGFDECYVCQSGTECELFNGISEHEINDLYDFLYARVDKETAFLVDASKKPRWFKEFVNLSDYEIFLIHLVRDPRALARRWLMRFSEKKTGLRERIKQIRKNPSKAVQLLFGDNLTICLYKWISQNRDIVSFIEESGLPYKRVTYKQLATETDQALESIFDLVGLQYEKGQKDYWNFSHHGSQKADYQWINNQGGGTYFDQRWREYLNSDQIKRIENHRDLQMFLKSIEVEFSQQGLEYKSVASAHNL